MKTLKITVAVDGTISIDAQGFQDKTCLDALADMEDILGCKATDIKLKPEAHRIPMKKSKA